MLSLLEYTLKVSAFIAAAWLFYRLVLSRLTSYASNRYYLIAAVLLALVLPLVRLDALIAPETLNSSRLINGIPPLRLSSAAAYVPPASANTATILLATVFLAGLLICLARFIMQLYSFRKITAKAQFLFYQAYGEWFAYLQ